MQSNETNQANSEANASGLADLAIRVEAYIPISVAASKSRELITALLATRIPEPSTDDEREVAWSTYVDSLDYRHDVRAAFEVGYDAGVRNRHRGPITDDGREALMDHLNGMMDSLDESVSRDQVYEQLQIAWEMARSLAERNRHRGTTKPTDRQVEL